MAPVVISDCRSPGGSPWATGDPTAELRRRAAALRALHRPGSPLVLPNIWDPGSARLVEAAGAPAVATSSAAVADSLGFADGEHTPVGEMLDAVCRIVRAVSVPVTADLERGYGMRPVELVERLAATGAAGCNLEDSRSDTGELVDPAEQADFLAAVRQAADDAGVDLVLNARIDVYLRPGRSAADRLTATADRGRRYLAAGADCGYPINVPDRAEVAELVRRLPGPVNVLCLPDWAPADLASLGVARVSFGARPYREVRHQLQRVIAALLAGAPRRHGPGCGRDRRPRRSRGPGQPRSSALTVP